MFRSESAGRTIDRSASMTCRIESRLDIHPYQRGLKNDRNMLIAVSRGSRSTCRHTAPGRKHATAGSHIHALSVLSKVHAASLRRRRVRPSV